MKLENTEIFRGGNSAAFLSRTTGECSFKVNLEKRALEFRFYLSAAGGGRTEVLLRIGLGDLTFLLSGIDKLRIAEVSGLQSKVKELSLYRETEVPALFKRIAALEAKLETLSKEPVNAEGGNGIN